MQQRYWSQMGIEVSLQINLRFEEGKKVFVGNISTKIKDLGLEQKLIETFIELMK
jgi:hypothetical protein